VTAPNQIRPDSADALHEMLARLAGKLPDDIVSEAREWVVATDRHLDLARAIASVVLAHEQPITSGDRDLLTELLRAAGDDPSPLSDAAVEDYDLLPPYAFTPLAPDADAGDGQRLTDPADEVDEAAVAAVAGEPGAVGLWRAWRSALAEAALPDARRVYVVEVDRDAAPHEVAVRLQQELEEAGEDDPQVEVHRTDADLPIYQRLARAYGALIWASAEAPEITMARVFDHVDATAGPGFRADHPRVEDDAELSRIVDYLNRGMPLLVTTAAMDDVVDRSRRAVVPMNFRTDGAFIWTDTVTYYLAEHRLEPEPDLLAHIRASGYEPPELTGVDIHRAMAMLQEPADEEPVWTFGGSSSGDRDEGDADE
jgi:hypothetical protein